MKYKLIVSDYDGTLIKKDGTIPSCQSMKKPPIASGFSLSNYWLCSILEKIFPIWVFFIENLFLFRR